MEHNTSKPLPPAGYRRRILLAVTGLSPQVVTETLFALTVERETSFSDALGEPLAKPYLIVGQGHRPETRIVLTLLPDAIHYA
jgi:hypothetical protein